MVFSAGIFPCTRFGSTCELPEKVIKQAGQLVVLEAPPKTAGCVFFCWSKFFVGRVRSL